METRTFTIVTSISMVLALTAAILSIIGIPLTGFYPAIVVFVLLAMIPVASRSYAKKNARRVGASYYTSLTFINLLVILVVLWMTFVIVHDRVLKDCC